jgi:hypothetical protein
MAGRYPASAALAAPPVYRPQPAVSLQPEKNSPHSKVAAPSVKVAPPASAARAAVNLKQKQPSTVQTKSTLPPSVYRPQQIKVAAPSPFPAAASGNGLSPKKYPIPPVPVFRAPQPAAVEQRATASPPKAPPPVFAILPNPLGSRPAAPFGIAGANAGSAAHRPEPMRVAQPQMAAPAVYRPLTAPVQRQMNGTVVQRKCATCGAKSHKTKDCPKTATTEVETGGGRGLTCGNKADLAALNVCLEKLDTDALYDDGAKSLVGGRKGKPSGLDDTSYRIDRQGKGNVQFQHDKDSLGKVTFSEDTKPGAIIFALRQSVKNCEEVDLT